MKVNNNIYELRSWVRASERSLNASCYAWLALSAGFSQIDKKKHDKVTFKSG